jgi:hypothetical protein
MEEALVGCPRPGPYLVQRFCFFCLLEKGGTAGNFREIRHQLNRSLFCPPEVVDEQDSRIVMFVQKQEKHYTQGGMKMYVHNVLPV